jgi:hypothetical protein
MLEVEASPPTPGSRALKSAASSASQPQTAISAVGQILSIKPKESTAAGYHVDRPSLSAESSLSRALLDLPDGGLRVV